MADDGPSAAVCLLYDYPNIPDKHPLKVYTHDFFIAVLITEWLLLR